MTGGRRVRLILGWGFVFLCVIVGLMLAWRHGQSVPTLLDTAAR